MPTLGQDTFTDNDGTQILAHTPDVGTAYSIWVDLREPAANSAVQIDNNVLSFLAAEGSDPSGYTINGANDLLNGSIQVTLKAGISSLGPALLARVGDEGYISFGPRTGYAGQWQLHTDNGDVNFTPIVTPVEGTVMKLVVAGLEAIAYFDDTEEATSATALPAGKWGFQVKERTV